jgi:N-acyl homoserine lactone hydrolase
VRLYIFHLGNNIVDKGTVLTPGCDQGIWWTVPVIGYLIQTDDGRNILVDTGMDKIHIQDPDATFRGTELSNFVKVEMRQEHYVVNRLAEVNLRPEDIDTVIATHFHFDHGGNTRDFTHSDIIVQRDCYDDIMREGVIYPRNTYELPDLKWTRIEGDMALAPGVTVLKTPGHVPGHMSVVVELPETGKIILGIDAIYVQDNLDHDNWGAYVDADASRASAKRLVDKARAEGGTLLFGHDPGQWKGLRKSPQFYS